MINLASQRIPVVDVAPEPPPQPEVLRLDLGCGQHTKDGLRPALRLRLTDRRRAWPPVDRKRRLLPLFP